jgi:aspartyl protease family protein
MNKLILTGVFAGIAASIPVLYQSNPEAFEAMLRARLAGSEAAQETAAAPQDPASPPRLAAVEADQPLLGRKVRLPADARGHFEAGFKLNGRNIQAMIDTGATVIALNESTARRIGIVLTPSDFTYAVTTANGKAKAAAATIDAVQIGKIYIEKVPAVVLEDSALSGTLVGMSFLKRLSKFQVENGAMVLQQ